MAYRPFGVPTVVSVALLAALALQGCGGAPAASSQTTAASLSSAEIFAATLGNSGSKRVAAIEATGALSFSSYYEQLISTSTDDVFTIDGVQVGKVRSLIESTRGSYQALEAQYSSVGAYWTASGYDPQQAISEDGFSQALHSAAEALSASKGPQALGLYGGTGVGDCNTYPFAANVPPVGSKIYEDYDVSADPDAFGPARMVLPVGSFLFASPKANPTSQFVRNAYNIVAKVAPITNSKTGAQVYVGATKYSPLTVTQTPSSTMIHMYQIGRSQGCKVQLEDGVVTSSEVLEGG